MKNKKNKKQRSEIALKCFIKEKIFAKMWWLLLSQRFFECLQKKLQTDFHHCIARMFTMQASSNHCTEKNTRYSTVQQIISHNLFSWMNFDLWIFLSLKIFTSILSEYCVEGGLFYNYNFMINKSNRKTKLAFGRIITVMKVEFHL